MCCFVLVIRCLFMFMLGFSALCRAAKVRRRAAFRPGTSKNHLVMFKAYIKFCLQHKVEYVNPSKDTICAYIEYLAQKFKSHKSVTNYVSAIKLLHKYLGVSPPSMDSFEVALMIRALPLTMRCVPQQKAPISIEMLKSLCELCDKLGTLGTVMHTLFLIAFYGFLRCSNLCPSTQEAFDTTRHPTRADIRVADPGLLMAQKWSKTVQAPTAARQIPIPRITTPSSLDPVTAFTAMISAVPTRSDNDALFQYPQGSPLTAQHARVVLRTMLTQLGYCAKDYSMHSFRIGGATACFRGSCQQMILRSMGAGVQARTGCIVVPLCLASLAWPQHCARLLGKLSDCSDV